LNELLDHGQTSENLETIQVCTHIGFALGGNAAIVVKEDPISVVGAVPRNFGCRGFGKTLELDQDWVIFIRDKFPGEKSYGFVLTVKNGISPIRLLLKAVGHKYGTEISKWHEPSSVV
jgi:hypothetical protein